jgi:asparagine synthase (glutamine-hydrolysing)
MPFPFTPGLTEPKLVDLSDPSSDLILDGDRGDLEAALAAGDVDALSRIGGSFAAVAQEGVTIRLARTIGRPLRYFVAKRSSGPYLVVADRIDAIARYCAEQEIGWQFHPSYTRLVPAHFVTELDQIGCPDPNPRYRRFFTPAIGRAAPDHAALGEAYLAALEETVGRIFDRLPPSAPIGVALSGGADSTAVAWAVLAAARARAAAERVRFFTLSVGGAADRTSAEAVARSLGVASRWTAVEAPLEEVSLPDAVRVMEDYRPLDVQCAAAMLIFARNLRRAEPGLVYLFDGDGGDENWKSYSLEDSEITIRSVVNNPLLYHEGWGVDSIKHSLTYSGGFSRGVVRGYAPARAFGFISVSPLAMRGAIAAALAAPLSELVGEDVDRLLALKGSVVRAGLRGRGVDLPIAEKRRFQHGAIADPGARLRASRAELRAVHERRFAALEGDDPDFPRGEPDRAALSA